MNAPTFPPVFNNEPLWKKQFAGYVHAGWSPFLAALKIWPHDNNLAYSKSLEWANDPHVVEEITRLKDEADAKLRAPAKDEFARDLRQKMQGMADDDYIKAARLMAEIQGFITKPEPPAPTQVNVSNVVNRVMIVKDHGTNEEWEAKIAAQQAKLVGNG